MLGLYATGAPAPVCAVESRLVQVKGAEQGKDIGRSMAKGKQRGCFQCHEEAIYKGIAPLGEDGIGKGVPKNQLGQTL